MFKKIIIIQLFILIFLFSNSKVVIGAETEDFTIWLSNFEQKALELGITKKTLDLSFKNIESSSFEVKEKLLIIYFILLITIKIIDKKIATKIS